MSPFQRGTKRLCQSCSAPYYDLGKVPPTCPTCGTPYDPALRSRGARPGPVREPAVKAGPAKAKAAAPAIADDHLPPVATAEDPLEPDDEDEDEEDDEDDEDDETEEEVDDEEELRDKVLAE